MDGQVRASAFIVSAVSIGLAFCAPIASATTEVSGDLDSNAPLVIDPSSDPDDALTTTQLSQTVLFIQRMPVTKRIDEVTIGDLAVAGGCPDATAYVQIQHHPDGDFTGSPPTSYNAIDGVDITSTLSKLTWDFSPVTLKKGEGYSFNIFVSGCWAMRQTTWEHNASQVNGGPDRCEDGPSDKRMWHVNGVDDAQFECVSSTPPSRRFDPSMPGGWLVSEQPASTWDITGGSYPIDDSSGNSCDSGGSRNPQTLGAGWAYWRPRPDLPEDYSEFVCRWGQFAPLDTEVADGWYYALPWLTERGGSPRDMYLELDTIDYDALLEDHVPILKYDSGENFHVLSPGALTDFYVDNSDPDDSNQLVDGEGPFAIANLLLAGDGAEDMADLDLDYLRPSYPPEAVGLPAKRRSNSESVATDYLSARGDDNDGFYSGDAAIMESYLDYPSKIYGRVAHGTEDDIWPAGKIWLQYWFFYYYNDVEIGKHEGDWEMVQVGLSSSNVPDVVAYAQHNGGQRCAWSSIESSSQRPVVYSAEGTHASYFDPNAIPVQYIFDHADGQGDTLLEPDLVQVKSQVPAWIGWGGKWGDSGSSPHGPQFQEPKWGDPSDWADGLDSC